MNTFVTETLQPGFLTFCVIAKVKSLFIGGSGAQIGPSDCTYTSLTVSEVPGHCEQIDVFKSKSRTTVLWFSTKRCLTSISWGLSALWSGFIASMFFQIFGSAGPNTGIVCSVLTNAIRRLLFQPWMVGPCVRPRGRTSLWLRAKAQFPWSVRCSVMTLLSDILYRAGVGHMSTSSSLPQKLKYMVQLLNLL